uniref:Uncharacterized protein n=1 Tax=Acrobeloides nanus TaxID=290746 RepID=A0A914BVQ7_9BILA
MFHRSNDINLQILVFWWRGTKQLGPGSAETVLVEVPHYEEPIRLGLKAEPIYGEGFVAIDDIQLESQICPSGIALSANSIAFSANSGISNTHTSSKNVPSPDANVCRLLSCDFDHGHMCLYESHRVASSVSMFKVYNGTARTMLFERSSVCMFESPIFQLNAPARLHFDFVIKGQVQLFVCQDSVRRELDSCYKVDTKKTPEAPTRMRDFVEVLPTDTKLYVITKLEKGSRKATVQVDNLLLTDSENHRIC